MVDFDPGVGVATRTAKGMVDLYVCKFDANGNFVWVQAAGGPGADQGVDVTVTPDGNVWATGVFQATVDFDPGSGTFSISAGSPAATFIWKLDSAGTFIWAGAFKGPNPSNI